MREVEKIGPPWELELVRDGGRLVEVVIRATGGAELGRDAIREATSALMTRMAHSDRPIGGGSAVLAREMLKSSGGKISPEYLATLAMAYEECARGGRAVIPALAEAIGGNPATVKGHVMRAREDGYLTKATPGREGGEATDKAREALFASANEVVEAIATLGDRTSGKARKARTDT